MTFKSDASRRLDAFEKTIAELKEAQNAAPHPELAEAIDAAIARAPIQEIMEAHADVRHDAPQRDRLVEAQERAEYNARNCWRGAEWLEAHPFRGDGGAGDSEARARQLSNGGGPPRPTDKPGYTASETPGGDAEFVGPALGDMNDEGLWGPGDPDPVRDAFAHMTWKSAHAWKGTQWLESNDPWTKRGKR